LKNLWKRKKEEVESKISKAKETFQEKKEQVKEKFEETKEKLEETSKQVLESTAKTATDYLGIVKAGAQPLKENQAVTTTDLGTVEITAKFIPTVPTISDEIASQPVAFAMDIPHQWKKSDVAVTVSNENLWENSEKTREVIQNLAEETQKSEEHIKEQLLHEQNIEDRR